MIASRVLPPIIRTSSPAPQPPVATFFNAPRRYVKSTMQAGENSPHSPMDGLKTSRNLRKSGRIYETRSAPTSNPTAERNKKEEACPPVASSPLATRKRLASIVAVTDREDSDSLTEDNSPQSAVSVTADSSDFAGGHVCLCQPEPKIPRPRNAFILYRQHHQQAIIARNPGLNNPDISKIIGEQWKAEGEEQKKVWQDLAQEEKAKHQEQYPDYRYQPRRLGRPGSSPLNPSGQHTTVDRFRCHRCGGRSPRTSTSPFLDASGTPTLPPPNISEGLTPTTRYLPVMSNLSLASPVHHRGQGPSNLSNIKITAAMRDDSMTMYSPLTPNKKRRFDYGPPPSATGRRPDGPYYPQTQYVQRESLPPVQMRYSPPNSATMLPLRTPRDGRHSMVEMGPSSHGSSPRSVGEVLSAFSYGSKIKLLGCITPPYKEPGSGSLSEKGGRGAIIAVEGDDSAAVRDLSEWLCDYLIKQGEFKPQMAEPPKVPSHEEKDVALDGYLDLIKEWHGKSKEMIKYITTTSITSSPPDVVMSDKDSIADTMSRKISAMPPNSPTTILVPMMKPVIILPTYQFQASVAYASHIPIQDSYSAADHWQWMATLWRGIVGPDLTLYVKSYDTKEGQVGQKPDMDEAARCLTVCKEKEGRFMEADLRRVGFEVGEWIKAVR